MVTDFDKLDICKSHASCVHINVCCTAAHFSAVEDKLPRTSHVFDYMVLTEVWICKHYSGVFKLPVIIILVFFVLMKKEGVFSYLLKMHTTLVSYNLLLIKPVLSIEFFELSIAILIQSTLHVAFTNHPILTY